MVLGQIRSASLSADVPRNCPNQSLLLQHHRGMEVNDFYAGMACEGS
jgi:hypothetical protein